MIYVAWHSGMVGSAIVRILRDKGFHNIITRSHQELDLCRQVDVEQFFRQERPEYVFCAAARVGGIEANKTYMADFLMENLLIQNHLLESAHRYQVKKLLFLASSCIYPRESSQPMKEEALLAGSLEPTNEGYALAKIAGLKACEYYKKQYGDNFICAMPANAYGVNDCFDEKNSHVIPALIRRFHEAKLNGTEEIVMWGSGKPLREFLYVDDLAEAVIFLMEHYDGAEFINVGTGEEVSMIELASMIRRVVGYEGRIAYDKSKPDGMMRRMVDSARIRQMGWRPAVSLEEGIRKEFEWYLDNICKSEKRDGNE